MMIILFIIIGLIALTVFTFIFPLIIGGFIAYLCFSGGGDHDCPYCGGGDTDGNHCYQCGEDF